MSSPRKRVVPVIPKPRAVDNSYAAQKIALRQQVYGALTERLGRKPRVLDLFCGEGQMWQAAYRDAETYLGVDLKPQADQRLTIQCDNRRLLRHVDFDVNGYDLFDIDAYGSPFEAFALLTSRINWEHRQAIGVLLTDETGTSARNNVLPNGFLVFLGYRPRSAERAGGLWIRQRRALIQRAIASCVGLASATVVQSWDNDDGQDGLVRYIGLVLVPE